MKRLSLFELTIIGFFISIVASTGKFNQDQQHRILTQNQEDVLAEKTVI